MTRRGLFKAMAGVVGVALVNPSKLFARFVSAPPVTAVTISEVGMQPTALLYSTPSGENFWWKHYSSLKANEEPDYILCSQDQYETAKKSGLIS